MQNLFIQKPYRFIPPDHGNLWPSLLQLYLDRYLSQSWGVAAVQCRHVDRLRASIAAGHGVLLTPNHSRLCDPLVLGVLSRHARKHFFAMASWHLFNESRFTTFMIRRMGAFSVYREGMDRAAINKAIEILVSAERPLVIFPEGATSRHNDRLMPLMEGTSFIARSAAKRRAKEAAEQRVVVHPVAIRYYFQGDLVQAVEPVLNEIEHRLSWRPQRDRPLLSRINRLGEAILSLKEIEHLGHPQPGDKFQRARTLIDHLLTPLEEEWKINEREASVVARVKRLRGAILPEMINGALASDERERRERQLSDCYLAQQIASYPEDYLRPDEKLPERILETVERFEEDLTDKARIHRPWHATVEVGEAIEVSPQRERKTGDAIMQGIEQQLEAMLAELAREPPRQSPVSP